MLKQTSTKGKTMNKETIEIGDTVYVDANNYCGPSTDIVERIELNLQGNQLYILKCGAWMTQSELIKM
jgi:hypothetical protein